MAKREGSRYECGVRSRDWVKLPHRTFTDVVVVGWVRAESGGGVASLAVAGPTGELLGTVGSGMTDRLSGALVEVLAGIARRDPDPAVHVSADALALLRRFGDRLTWVEPLLVAEVRHLGRTESGALRQPTLARMRPDVAPCRPTREHLVRPAGSDPVPTVVAGRRLRLTNLDKVLYPQSGTTKAEVFSYILAVGEPMLAQLANRPITRRRWPDGVEQPDFFEKAVRPGTPEWMGHVHLRRSGDDYSGYIDHPLLAGTPEDAAALVWFVQQGALEFHTPQWRIGRKFGLHGTPGPADRMVLDLDPGPPAGLAECAEVALVAREILAGAGFTAVPVASGSKGLHVYVPLPRPVPSS